MQFMINYLKVNIVNDFTATKHMCMSKESSEFELHKSY